MRSIILGLAFLCSLAPLGHAATTYYINSSITGANTKVSLGDEAVWGASTTPYCFSDVASCETFTVSEFSPTFSWTLGGGSFIIKKNTNTSGPILLRLWENLSGTLAAPVGDLRASVSIADTLVTGSFTRVLFQFATPYQLQAAHAYVLTLTATTPAKKDYSFKSPDGFSDSFGNPLPPPTDLSQVPEPGTFAMVCIGTALLLVARRRASAIHNPQQ